MNKADECAKIIWDYMVMKMPLQKCECIFVLGSNDVRVAEYVSQLLLDGYGDYIVFSGGYGNFTKGTFKKPEADLFAEIAISMGVSENKILIENKATNTGENVHFTLDLLEKRGLKPQSWLLVQKPFMERRSYATFKKVLPNAKAIVTSPQIAFEEYDNEIISKEALIYTVAGDMQRIIEYPKKGYMIEQDVPKEVVEAMNCIIQMGYTEHLLK
ncbi:YdcF family protein [Paludicola sp. MB14-C6]|uniref:YdcF family protein n=1 Tax=Paludihabitans sp. MB14-C6 TaxID=3070656 RepID=UPI0027DBB282|nr:YdcF family protein [Paludicola sp. MB14-C6]WMJ22357.1 YdcF family protein [Paludicola sp. MB14-C6]